MNQKIDHLKFVNDLEVTGLKAAFPASRSDEVATANTGEQSFINAKSLVSFVSEVSSQNRQDVLNSVLLAQLAANTKFPEEENSLEWYKEFIRVLNNIGWTIEEAQFSRFNSSHSVFEVQNAIIDIITTAFGGVFLPIIKKTLEAIKNLGDSTGKIIAFEKNTHSLSKGAFQIGLANETDSVVVLQLGTFMLTSTSQIKQILFFKSSKDETTLDYNSRKATLNSTIYSKVREAVAEKLGFKAEDFITGIQI